MHDLDRAMFEYAETPDGRAEYEESEHEEFLGMLSGVLRGEAEAYEGAGLGEAEFEAGDDRTTREMALASEMLEVTSEAELDRFIGNLLKGAAGAVRDLARSDTGRALGGILKQAAGQALPVIGRAIGGAVSPRGADVGARLGSAAGRYFGLELEGLTSEDREFEVARAFVRFAEEACRHALKAPPTAPPAAVARAAAATAAQRHAPGLLPVLLAGVQRPGGAAVPVGPAGAATPAGIGPGGIGASPGAGPAGARAGMGGMPAAGAAAGRASGRWARQGDRIVIFGV
jgi:hypothetical protein